MSVEAEQLASQGVVGGGPIAGDPDSKQDIWVLGQRYTFDEWTRVGERIALLPWFTYRRGFPRIGSTPFQSDQGWGCMLRCGQMLLAEAFLACQRTDTRTREVGASRNRNRKELLARFADTPEAPYSIHNVALRGGMMDKQVGDWFGPNCMAQVIRSLSVDSAEKGLAIHVAMDGYVCIEEVLAMADAQANGGAWKPLLLLVPLRLGLDEISEKYNESLKEFFTCKQCLGAIGGRPNAAFYFVGHRKDELLYLDPHRVQMTVGPITKHTSIASYSRSSLDALRLADADPSLSLGYLCSSRDEFTALMASVEQSDHQALFTVVEKDFAAGMLSGDDDFALSEDDGNDAPVSDDGFELINLP